MEINHILSKPSVKDDTFSIHSNRSFTMKTKELLDCQHSGIKDIYCNTHRMMACRTCLVKQHKLCDLQNITDVTKECSQEEVEKLVKELDTVKEHIKDAMKELENEKSLLHKEKAKAVKKIKEFKSQMLERLDSFEKEALHNLETTFIEYQDKTKAMLQEAEQCLTSFTVSLKTIVSDESPTLAQIITCKESKEAVQETKEKLHKLKVLCADIELIPDSRLLHLFSEITTLGECRLNFKRDPTVLYEVAQRREIRVEFDINKNDCNITGADCLPDGNILLADRSSKKILRIDTISGVVKDHINFPSEPWGVCIIHATEAAVSFPEELKNIKFISIARRMKETRALKLRHSCRGLAFNGNELFVTDQGVFVHVYTLDGTLLRKFSKDGHVGCKLTDFQSIAVRDNLVVLADWNEGLMAFNENGKLIWKYDDHDLKRAGGLCFDETGNIIACGSQSINVIHVNRDGKKIGEIANTSNGLVYPTAVCFDKQNSLMVVAQQEADAVLFRVK